MNTSADPVGYAPDICGSPAEHRYRTANDWHLHVPTNRTGQATKHCRRRCRSSTEGRA